MKHDREKLLEELMPLMFGMRRLMRSKLAPDYHADPHAWLRLEVLRYIEDAGEPTMQDIAKNFRIAAPSATSLIAKLVQEGMATRKHGEKDKRIVCVCITRKGRAALLKKQVFARKVVHEIMHDIPESDLEFFISALRRVHAANGVLDPSSSKTNASD